MAIAKKPKSARTQGTPTEAEIEAVIERGGRAPSETRGRRGEGNKAFLVRIDPGLLESIDEAVRRNPVIRSRNTWVVNAIYEQLKRDGLV